MFTLGVIAIIFALFMLHGALVDAIKGPSSRAGGNPNAPGSYRPQPSVKPPTPHPGKGFFAQEAQRQLLPPPPPPAGKSYDSFYQEPPPRPQIVYLTDSDPTPPYGIPRVE